MPNEFDYVSDALFAAQDRVTAVKEQNISKAAALKKHFIDPDYTEFDPDMYEVMDADTLRHRRTGVTIRPQGPEGESIDSFEVSASTYEDNPKRMQYHKQAYARLFGKDVDDVSMQDLLDMGEVQKARLTANLEGMRGQGMTKTGLDQYGRQLTQFDDSQAFEQARGIEGNASYFAPFNYNRLAKDLVSGDLGEVSGSGERTWVEALQDQGVQLSAGAMSAVTGLMQGIDPTKRFNIPMVDAAFTEARRAIEEFQTDTSSPGKQYREKMDAKLSSINPELFEIRKARAIEEGLSPGQATMSAGLQEATDRVGYLIENPGRILDATIESLPYMAGVGIIGRKAMTNAVTKLQEEALKRITAKAAAKGVKEAPEVLARQAAVTTGKFIASKAGQKHLSKVASNTGMTSVGLIEGLTSSADVYDSIINMTPEEASESAAYRALIEGGMDHGQAVNKLANKASTNTLLSVSLMAAAAGRLTGAAAFESKLFSGLAKTRKPLPKAKVEPVKPKKAPKTRAVAKVVLAVPKKVVKTATGPALREAAEEAMQSGGGEFLSQLASFEATQKPVGPGIGAATAEGAVVGFASGAGASVVTGALKSVAQAATKPRGNSSGLRAAAKAPAPVSGGSFAPHAQAPQTGQAKELFDSLMTAIENEDAMDPFQTISTLEEAHVAHLAEGGTFTAAEEQVYQQLQAYRKESIAAAMNEVRKKNPETYTAQDRALINEAGRLGIIKKADKTELPEDAQDALEISSEINTLEKEAETLLGQQLVEATGTAAQKRAVTAHNEKFADAVGPTGPGLGWYRREMLETMTAEDTDSRVPKFTELSTKLSKFIGSQAKKLNAYKAVVASEQSTKSIKFRPQVNNLGGTQGLVEQMEQELQIMTDTHAALQKQFEVWNPEAGLEAIEIPVISQETAPEAPSAPEVVEEAPAVIEEPVVAPEPTEEVTEVEDTAKAEPEAVAETVEEVVEEPVINKEVIESATTMAEILREGKKVPAIGVSKQWNNFKDKSAESLEWIRGSWIWGKNRPIENEDQRQELLAEIERKFAKAKLPTSLADVFKRKSQTTNTLFGAVPNLMEVLEDKPARTKLFKALKLSKPEQDALSTFRKYYQQFSTTLADIKRDFDQTKSYADKQLQESALPYFENNLGEMDPNVVAAMAFEAMNWATTTGPGTTYNDDFAINNLLGRPTDSAVTAEERTILNTAGTVRNTAVREIGNAIWKHLSLQKIANTTVDPLFMDKLIVSLGGMALSVLQQQNRVETTTVDSAWFAKARQENPENDTEIIEAEGKRVNFVRNMTELVDTEQGPAWRDTNSRMTALVQGGQDMFAKLFGADPNVRMPSLTGPPPVPTKISRSVAKISKKMQTRMKSMTERVWRAETPVLSVLGRMDMREYLEMAHGYVNENDLENVHVTQLEGVKGRNRGLERDFSSAMEWNEEHGSSPFHFAYKMIRSGRIYINSNVINPQSSKLHRFMFGMKEWNVGVPVDPQSAAGIKTVEDFKIALALGFGINADKLMRAEVLTQIEAVLASQDMADALEVLNREGDEQFNFTEMAAFDKFLRPAKGQPGGEGTHTMAALIAWNTYNNADAVQGTVQVSIPMETDGITNGFIAGLLQTPPARITEEYRELLRAGGYFFKGDKWQSYPEWIADGGRDNYQQVADATGRLLRQMSKGLLNVSPKNKFDFRDNYVRDGAAKITGSGLLPKIDELSLTKGRQWAKNPLMVVSYGASVASVVRAITAAAYEDFHANLAEAAQSANPAEAIAAAINAGHDIANVALAANRKAGVDEGVGPAAFGITVDQVQTLANRKEYGGDLRVLATNFKLEGDALTLFNLGIELTYGAALGSALTEKLQPLQAIRAQLNHANKLMNQIFVRDFVRRVDTLESDGRTLGPQDREQIYNEMHAEGLVPAVATAFSEELNENLEVTNYETAYLGGKNAVGEAKFNRPIDIINRAYDAEGNRRTPKAQAAIFNRIVSKMPNTDVGVSGVVKLIHALDGVNNSEAWGNNPVLNVHDAQVGPFTEADRIAGDTNADFVTMHAGYSLADQILESTSRMMSQLLAETDSRLSPREKAGIYRDFVAHLQEFGALTEEQVENASAQELTEDWFRSLQFQVDSTNSGRSDLFAEGSWINQFAKEGSERQNPEAELAVPDPILSDRTLSASETLEAYRGYLRDGVENEQQRNQVINTIKDMVISGNDPNPTIRAWIDYASPSAAELIDVLQAAYQDTISGRALSVLNNVLKPYLGYVSVNRRPLRTSTGEPRAAKAIYSSAVETISFNSLADDTSMVSTAFHEAIHAANVARLQELERENPQEFEKLYDKAIQWARDLARERKPDSAKYIVAAQILQYRKGAKYENTVSAVSEYMAYALTTPSNADDFTLYSENVVELLGDLMSTLRDPAGKLTLHNTGAEVDPSLFEDVFETLEADKMQRIFEDLAKYDQGPTNTEHATTLQNLLNNFIIPGIQSLETVMQQEIAQNPYGTEHIGEIEGDRIRLQASGNKLSSNMDMSMQETAMHEYTHGILQAAIEGDHFVRKEANRLYDLAEKHLTVEDLLPATIVGDPAIAQEKAQERYDYIFNNPLGNNLHEFMAIGLTNKEFADALREVDNREAAVLPTLKIGSGILTNMMELLRSAIQWLAGQSLRTKGGNIHEGVYSLAKSVIAINQRNMQRNQDLATGQDQTTRLGRANDRVVNAINNRVIEPLRVGMKANEKKRLDPENPTAAGFIKATTYVALATRDKEVRNAYNEVYRAIGGGKDNAFFEIMQEFTPWNQENIGTDTAPGWIDLLRKSKVIVDMARQEVTEHTRSYINKSFDKNNHLNEETKEAVTRVMLKTDIISLMEGDHGLKIGGLQDLLNDNTKINTLLAERNKELQDQLAIQGASQLYNVFSNQSNSLASFMVSGVALVENPMLNAHNIVNQHMLSARDKVGLTDKAKIIQLVDQITTLRALQKTPNGDISLALDMINHEMEREDAKGDNGFSRLLGMQINFKKLSTANLFDGDPVQMIKGYVYEIFDGDVNIEIVDDTLAERERMSDENMILVGPLVKDNLDPNRRGKVLYKGLKGLAGYNKSIVSLTDMQHRGTNLFAGVNYDTQKALQNLGTVQNSAFRSARNQFQADYVKPGSNMVPVLNSNGDIVDYRYMMSEKNKQKILKKKDPFDKVLPRMFASITDRNSTKTINSDVADLLWKEYDGLKDSRAHKFVQVGRYASTKAGKDMWNLLPIDMQMEIKDRFGTEGFHVRDDVANLVLGFRKLSISNLKMLGKTAPVVRTAEKWWQEIVQLMRIKIAVLTPAVVVGNAASNTAILLSEGIPTSYIRRKGSEAISAMRLYQRDVRRRDELAHQIGVDSGLGKDVRRKINELTRLRADIAANPVGQLVQEGLFTSIAEDLGANDDSLRGHLINRAVDKTKGVIPDKIVEGVKELYMLPGTRGYKAGVAATQYGDFVGRYIKFNYDIDVRKKDKPTAIKEALATFIYYDIPQNKQMQFLNDSGFMMFTKFFMRIQPIVAKLYTQNPASAFGVLAMQAALLPDPFNENIMNYGLGDGLMQKFTPNPIGKAWDTLNPSEPALLQWILNPFGL